MSPLLNSNSAADIARTGDVYSVCVIPAYRPDLQRVSWVASVGFNGFGSPFWRDEICKARLVMLLRERKAIINTSDYIGQYPRFFHGLSKSSRNVAWTHREGNIRKLRSLSTREECRETHLKCSQSDFITVSFLFGVRIRSVFAQWEGDKLGLDIDIFRWRMPKILQVKVKCYLATIVEDQRRDDRYVTDANPRTFRQIQFSFHRLSLLIRDAGQHDSEDCNDNCGSGREASTMTVQEIDGSREKSPDCIKSPHYVLGTLLLFLALG
jgi:hypothetical protein